MYNSPLSQWLFNQQRHARQEIAMVKNYAEEETIRTHQLKNTLKLIGRILLSAIFLINGFGQVFRWNGVAVFSQTNSLLPLPIFIITTAIFFQILGGLLILVGYKTRIGAILLIIFIIPATLYFHHFWDLDDISQLMQIQLFFKNVALIGGLFGIIANGPGAWSIDGRILRSKNANG